MRRNDHFHDQVVTHVDCTEFEALEGWSFACECAAAGCHDSIELTLAEFRMVRAATPRHIAIAPGHLRDAGFQVVARHTRFEIAKESS